MSKDDAFIKKVKLSEIQTADKNPKDHDVGAIYQSMKRFGFVAFPLINSTTDKLLAGHGRLKTLQIITVCLTNLIRLKIKNRRGATRTRTPEPGIS